MKSLFNKYCSNRIKSFAISYSTNVEMDMSLYIFATGLKFLLSGFLDSSVFLDSMYQYFRTSFRTLVFLQMFGKR